MPGARFTLHGLLFFLRTRGAVLLPFTDSQLPSVIIPGSRGRDGLSSWSDLVVPEVLYVPRYSDSSAPARGRALYLPCILMHSGFGGTHI